MRYAVALAGITLATLATWSLFDWRAALGVFVVSAFFASAYFMLARSQERGYSSENGGTSIPYDGTA